MQILIYRGVIAAPNRLFRPPFQRWLSTSSGAVQGRAALGSALSFVSFSLGLFLQRKAAKPFWYQDLLDAFSFATRGTNLSCLTYVSHLLRKTESEKALQKENAVFALTPRGRSLLKKRRKTIVRSECELTDKSQFIAN